MKFPLLLFVIILCCSCNGIKNTPPIDMTEQETSHEFTNSLINETSPYLLQHAHNPVNWYPWGEEALQKAKEEDKLILISIGYSACHWCHVMEHESFEDVKVAEIMNENFINIKVDREERPDIDQIYMNAVQLMSGRGGWPLNCFALPDGRPVYGGTYFPKSTWTDLLQGINKGYHEEREKFEDYAEKLTNGIRQSELMQIAAVPANFEIDSLKSAVDYWKRNFDHKEGGPNKAPKFPLPNNYQFLLRYGHLTNDSDLLNHVHFTLRKMAYGGIYDQIGGGFARYSTDIEWKVPHFEKMLYDNAQLITLYSEAFQANNDPLYKRIVYQTAEFIDRELTSDEGAFYSALDADSEGEEGKFYVWKDEELQSVLGDLYPICKSYYNVGKKGFWEHGNNILLRDDEDEKIAVDLNISVDELRAGIEEINTTLLNEREKRVRPGLDDKSLTSWNAMLITAYCDAYLVFDDKKFLQAAEKCYKHIITALLDESGVLLHSYKEGVSKQTGFLEDYAFVVDAALSLYGATFDESYLTDAKKFSDQTIAEFYDDKSGMFFFTSNSSEQLIARKYEINDNVIPASNSVLARSLFKLGKYFDEKKYSDMSEQMLSNVMGQFSAYPSGYSNWMMLYLESSLPYYEVAIVGKEASDERQKFSKHYVPNKLYIGSTSESELPLLENKYVENATMYYVCLNKSCKLPVENVSDAIKQVE